MRLYVPELEIILDNVGCENLKLGDGFFPSLIVDFRLCKYPSVAYKINSISVSLERNGDSYDLDWFFISKPLKDIILESKKSENKSAMIKMEDLPFQGVSIGDKLIFNLNYFAENTDNVKQKKIGYILKEKGWELYGNTCDLIRNTHYTKFTLPIFEEKDVSVILTGIAYDFKQTIYYFSISNYTDKTIRVFSYNYLISVLRNGNLKTYENPDDILISEVRPNGTTVGLFTIANSPFSEFDYDLMTELDVNSLNCRATVSLLLHCESNDKTIDLLSDWIVGEIGIHPAVPSLEEDAFEYEENADQSVFSPKPSLTYQDFVIYSHAFRCLNSHKTEMINAIVKIATHSGKIIEESVNAAYCSTCNKYIILESDYERLKSYGVILCRQISFERYVNNQGNVNGFRGWKEQSELRQLGYTVNAKDDLSEEQRHAILIAAIESELYTEESLKSFLTLLVESNQEKEQNRHAVQKWKSDIDFISNYNTFGKRNVGVKSFTKTNYRF